MLRVGRNVKSIWGWRILTISATNILELLFRIMYSYRKKSWKEGTLYYGNPCSQIFFDGGKRRKHYQSCQSSPYYPAYPLQANDAVGRVSGSDALSQEQIPYCPHRGRHAAEKEGPGNH